MLRSVPILIAVILSTPIVRSQDLQLEEGAVGSYLRLKELQTTASVLHVVAHPDDEDGAMLAYCARGLGARTMLFSLTRGEGGANLISSHFFDELGALRTLEHLKAASYYGNELFYSRAADYGYSKTLYEAMNQWQNGNPLLEDLVEVIRRERPTVMLSRFAGDPRDGHGHHQMAGVISRRAFHAAADPKQFPDQIKRGLQPWQVKKLYVRAGSPWRPPEAGEWSIALPTGTYDPVIGRSYAQIARFGLGFQRSQGISGHEGEPGPRPSYYRLVNTAEDGEPVDVVKEESILEGLDTSLAGLVQPSDSELLQQTKRSLARIEDALAQAYETWDPRQHVPTVDALTKQLNSLRRLDVLAHENSSQLPKYLLPALMRLEKKLQRAITTLAGLRLDAWATDAGGEEINHVSVDPFRVHIRLANQSPFHSVEPVAMQVEMPGQVRDIEVSRELIGPGALYEKQVDLEVNLPPTRPHWRRASISAPLYQTDPTGQQRPLPKAPLIAKAQVRLGGTTIELTSEVHTRIRHPEYGRVQYRLTAAPTMSVRFPSPRGIVVQGRSSYLLPAIVRNCRSGPAKASIRLRLPQGWSSIPDEQPLAFQRQDEEATVDFEVSVPPETAQRQYGISAIVESNGEQYNSGFETVTARDLGRLNIYRDAEHQLQIAAVEVLGTPNVGYIPGSGDKVAESLSTLGITPTMLSGSDLEGGDLSKFDIILVGVRAYAVREDIRTHNARLLDYVKRGGTLIVQYQTPEFNQNFGPYPYDMSRPEEVSEEDSVVTIIEPEHPLFTTPNQITAADFDGWFEQRGSKFWKTWDENYTALLECHDQGQPPQRGGQLIARYGKGVYVYTAYAWYRQLPNGVPGAYRLFANLLSLPKSGLVE